MGPEENHLRREASFHAEQHGQPGLDIPELRTLEGSREAGSGSDGDQEEGAG